MIPLLLKGLGKKLLPKLLPKLVSKILGEGKAIKKAKLSLALDRNKDGKISLKDFPGLEKYADFNGDGKVDFADLIELAKKNNRQKLYFTIGLAVVGGVAYFFANKYGLL